MSSSTELAGIEGFDEELAEELQSRAQEALERQEEAHRAERRELGVEDALAEIPHLTEQMLVVLGKAGIKTLDDLADLATDELIAKKREAPRRRNARRPARRCAATAAHRGQGRRARRVRPERRAGQRDHHGRPRALVRGRGGPGRGSAPAAEEAADAESSQ